MKRLLLLLNIILVLGLLGSYVSQYVHPEKFYLLAFLGLSAYVWVLANLAFICLWLILKFRYIFMSVIALVIVFPNMLNKMVALNWREQLSNTGTGIKIMSYNVRLFGLYDWKNNIRNRNDILNYLKKEEPDIVCFQEFFFDKSRRFTTIDTIKKLLKARNIHFEAASSLYDSQFWGVATCTRFPIINKGKIKFQGSKGNICIYSDIQIGDNIVRVYNVHFESYHLPEDRLDRMADDLQENPKYWLNVFRLMARSYERRGRQVDIVRASMDSCPHPVIVCGDFNELVTSYVYRQMSRGMKDAFLESGFGLGVTYAGRIPLLRIDYILHSPQLRSSSFKVSKVKLSDHYPISSVIKLPEN